MFLYPIAERSVLATLKRTRKNRTGGKIEEEKEKKGNGKEGTQIYCLIIDLHNREIIGKACGRRKEAALVEQAFLSIRHPLDRIAIFHTDRGSEFKNECIDRIIKAFDILRSLSRKGCPYDNAVAEATYSIFKAEFAAGSSFSELKELERALNDYVLWYNNVRLNGSLGYLSPVAYRQSQNPPVR